MTGFVRTHSFDAGLERGLEPAGDTDHLFLAILIARLIAMQVSSGMGRAAR